MTEHTPAIVGEGGTLNRSATAAVDWLEGPGEVLAGLLAAARHDGRQIAALDPGLLPPTHDAAYTVNARVAARLGWEQLGWKIAATTAEMQRRLRTNVPIYGRTFTRFLLSSPATLVHGDLLDPLVECEFFFRLGRALPPRDEPWRTEEVADVVAAVHTGIEIAECRFPRACLPPVPAVLADGAASGHYVIGPEIPNWRCRNLAAMPVVLEVDGILRRTGNGHDVMGDPLAPLVWLANERSRLGDGLAAGALVSTGTATGMLLAKRGERMRARFGTGLEITVDFV